MEVFDKIKLFISVCLPLGTGLYGFLLGGDVAAAIWTATTGNDMTVIKFLVDWCIHISIAMAFALSAYWLSKWILKKMGLDT
tara:strand:+ start:552 stop:797 length:246 start_codon:yes stop_codon:yes gene_type:complete